MSLLAMFMGQIVTVFDPDLVVIGGGLSQFEETINNYQKCFHNTFMASQHYLQLKKHVMVTLECTRCGILDRLILLLRFIDALNSEAQIYHLNQLYSPICTLNPILYLRMIIINLTINGKISPYQCPVIIDKTLGITSPNKTG